MRGVNGADQFIRIGIFEQVTGGSGSQCPADIFFAFVLSQDQDVGAACLTPDLFGSMDAVGQWHGNIYQYHVRFELADEFYGLAAIIRLGNHFKIGLARQKGANPISGMV